jgi:hypothetical protein
MDALTLNKEAKKMKIQDALSLLGLTSSATQADIKAAYKKMILKYHPDRNPADLEMSKSINVAFQTLRNYDGLSAPVGCAEININLSEEIEAAIKSVINLSGVVVELCGTWIWLSGNTKEHKEAIKEAGYKWSPKKTMWHWSPSEDKRKCRTKSVDMDSIRNKYGSAILTPKTNKYQQLPA